MKTVKVIMKITDAMKLLTLDVLNKLKRLVRFDPTQTPDGQREFRIPNLYL